MSHEPRRVPSPAGKRELDLAEQRFYVVMHHLATVLWMKGATVEALGSPHSCRGMDQPAGRGHQPAAVRVMTLDLPLELNQAEV